MKWSDSEEQAASVILLLIFSFDAGKVTLAYRITFVNAVMTANSHSIHWMKGILSLNKFCSIDPPRSWCFNNPFVSETY